MLLGIGSIWFSEPAGTWRYFISRCLIWASVPIGIIFACVTHRRSIVQGLAGDIGYEELDDKPDEKSSSVLEPPGTPPSVFG